LQEVNRENPFKVPENYFARFNEEIMYRLPEKEFVPPRKVSLWEKARPLGLLGRDVGRAIFHHYLRHPIAGGWRDFVIEEEAPVPTTIESASDSYWSTVYITEEEFYQYLEDH